MCPVCLFLPVPITIELMVAFSSLGLYYSVCFVTLAVSVFPWMLALLPPQVNNERSLDHTVPIQTLPQNCIKIHPLALLLKPLLKEVRCFSPPNISAQEREWSEILYSDFPKSSKGSVTTWVGQWGFLRWNMCKP